MSNAQQQERRSSQRLELNKAIQIELPSGDKLMGESLDISSGGVLLKFANLPDSLKENQSIKLHLVLHDGEMSSSYNCTIIRIVRNCLALQLELKQSAEFAQQVQEAMFTRKSDDLENP